MKKVKPSDLVLNFWVWAVVAILVTRLFLTVMTDGFKLTFGDWHIAHVLYGGLFMLSSMMVFISRGNRLVASALGGIGWGLFIDEIGKYLSQDNDYWFQPAVIFIYVSMVLIFLYYRLVDIRERKNGGKEWLINWERLYFGMIRTTYGKIFNKRWTKIVLLVYSIYFGIDSLIDWLLVLDVNRSVHMKLLKLSVDLLVSVMLYLGWWQYLHRKRSKGLRWFRWALLVNIFLGAVFRFYFEQFSAVFALFLTVTVYGWVTTLHQEVVEKNRPLV